MGEWEKVTGPTTRKAKKQEKPSEIVKNKEYNSKSKIPQATRKPLREKNTDNSSHGVKAGGSKVANVQKTLEECSKAIGSGKELQKEVNGLYERNKDRPNVWLNEMVKLVVSKCTIQDKFVPKGCYLKERYIDLAGDVEKVIVNALKDDASRYIKPHTRSTLYHETILSMSEDSARNKPTVGYRVILQILATNFPTDSQKSISDRLYFNASTAHAYRSNPSTCMPLLWAMGAPFLAAPLSLTTQPAIDIFERAMIPVSENKPLNHYTVHYFSKVCQQAKAISMKKPLFSHTHVAKLIDLTFNANFDQADSAKVKDAILNDLIIPAAAFEHLLALLDKSKNPEFRNFVLQVILKLFTSQYGEEACQIWNLNYGGSITESAILLKFLLEEMSGMNKKTKTLLSKTAKQFCKANAKFMENADKPAANKKAMEWVDDMCKDILNGGLKSVDTKNSKKVSKTTGGNKSAGKSCGSCIFNLVWYMAILYFLIGFMQDLSSVNYQWSKTSSRNFLASAHPFVNQNLPVIEENLNFASDFIVSRTSLAYNSLHNLAPAQFDVLEDYASLTTTKVNDLCQEFIVPNLNAGFNFIDLKLVETYLWVKSNQYDVKISAVVEEISGFLKTHTSKVTQVVGQFSEKVVLAIEQVQQDAPGVFNTLKGSVYGYYTGLQLTVGKFVLKVQPIISEYFGIVQEKSAKIFESLDFNAIKTTSLQYFGKFQVAVAEYFAFFIVKFIQIWGVIVEFSETYLSEFMVVAREASAKVCELASPYWNQVCNLISPYWTLLEQQFFQVFDHVMELVDQFNRQA
jgi:hypothetical protein